MYIVTIVITIGNNIFALCIGGNDGGNYGFACGAGRGRKRGGTTGTASRAQKTASDKDKAASTGAGRGRGRGKGRARGAARGSGRGRGRGKKGSARDVDEVSADSSSDAEDVRADEVVLSEAAAQSNRQLRPKSTVQSAADSEQVEGGSQREGVLQEEEDDGIDWEAAMPDL